MNKEDINRIAWKLGLSSKEVECIYKLFFKYVAYSIANLDTNNPKRASFNLPRLGKLVFNEKKLNVLKDKLDGKKDS